MLYLLMSLIGIDKASNEGNVLMQGICFFGLFVSFFVGVVFYLQAKIDQIDLK